jgi:hypothetical protein
MMATAAVSSALLSSFCFPNQREFQIASIAVQLHHLFQSDVCVAVGADLAETAAVADVSVGTSLRRTLAAAAVDNVDVVGGTASLFGIVCCC